MQRTLVTVQAALALLLLVPVTLATESLIGHL